MSQIDLLAVLSVKQVKPAKELGESQAPKSEDALGGYFAHFLHGSDISSTI